jgi:acetate---CoA ligase (ADP-forming)
VVGASNNPEKVGCTVLHNLVRHGYKGEIIPINPKEKTIQGLPAYPSLTAYGRPVGLVVVIVPRQFVRGVAEEAIAMKAGALTVITAGFKEQDAAGAAMERDLAELCRRGGIRMVGPNCLGLINTHHRLDASFGNKFPHKGTVSFFSQSGALCTAILDRVVELNMGMAKLVSIGNKADLSEVDFLHAFGEDPETGVIVGYVESSDNGRAFVETASRVCRKKPVILFKSGITSAGAKAASSHTGSLAGADVAYQAAFRRSGIVRANTFEQMFDFANAFAMQPLPRGKRVAVVTNAGGPGIMTTDAIEMSGLKMAELTEETKAELTSFLPAAASVKNPVDVLGDAQADRYEKAIARVVADPNVDAIIVLLTPQSVTKIPETARAVIECKNEAKPILCSFLGGEDVSKGTSVLLANHVPNYSSPERAVNALKAMYEYALWREAPERKADRLDVDHETARRLIDEQLAAGALQVDEPSAKAILRAYGIRLADGGLVASAAEAGALADRIGFPLVMKIVSPDVIHKSDMGGVRLNLKSRDEVEDAFKTMTAHIRAQLPDARIKGVYIERMCNIAKGREVIVGVSRDPQFGAMIMCGLGGIFVEVFKDVTFELAPVGAEDARDMLRRIKAFPLLEGVRGQAGMDLATIEDTIRRVSLLVTDFPCIRELDINPFIAMPTAEASIAADARMTLTAKA